MKNTEKTKEGESKQVKQTAFTFFFKYLFYFAITIIKITSSKYPLFWRSHFWWGLVATSIRSIIALACYFNIYLSSLNDFVTPQYKLRCINSKLKRIEIF